MESRAAWFDPWTGQETDSFGNPIEGGTTVFDYTSGTWTIDRGQFVAVSDPFQRYTLGKQGATQITDFGGTQFMVQSQTLAGAINRMTGPNNLRLVAGTTQAIAPDGSIIDIVIEPTAVAQAGRQWIAYPQAGGLEAYTQVVGPFETDADVQRVYGPNTRLASAEEAGNFALLYSLVTNNRAALRDKAIELQMFNEDGTPDISGLARALMKTLSLDQLDAFSNFLVSSL